MEVLKEVLNNSKNDSNNLTQLENHVLLLDNTTFDDRNITVISSECGPFVASVLHLLFKYYIPIIIAFGFVGNSLSCIIFMSSHLKFRSSSYYLSALAIADFGYLFVVLIVRCSFNGVLGIYNMRGWCQIFVYVSSVCANLSVWIVVAFTGERFIAVERPLQRPRICTVRRAKIIITSLLITMLLFNSYLFWTAGIIKNHHQGHQECGMLTEYMHFMRIANLIDTITMLIVPFVMIVVMNTMIIIRLKIFSNFVVAATRNETHDHFIELHQVFPSSSACHHHSGKSDTSQMSNITTSSGKSMETTGRENRSKDFRTSDSSSNPQANVSTSKYQQNITKMLLLISSVFIALNLPSYIVRMVVFLGYTIQEKSPPNSLWCIQQFTMLLYYTHFSINFLLYTMCGLTFRRYMKELIKSYFTNLRGRILACWHYVRPR